MISRISTTSTSRSRIPVTRPRDVWLDGTGHADPTYRVPDGFTLHPDATVTLYTGSGEDPETDLYRDSGSAIWNNGGDTIIIKDASGAIVIEREYS